MLEIGPGLGPLTELLVEQVGGVLAIEKDGRLVEVLRSVQRRSGVASRPETDGGTPVLRLIHDDVLDYLRREARDWSEWKMVANLPYLCRFALAGGVGAARRAARSAWLPHCKSKWRRGCMPNRATPDYGVFTLLVQLNYEPQTWFKIPASCFFPEPEVDSACVCLVRREPPPLTEDQRRVLHQSCEAQVLPAAQDDAQTAEAGLATAAPDSGI